MTNSEKAEIYREIAGIIHQAEQDHSDTSMDWKECLFRCLHSKADALEAEEKNV